MQRFDFIVSDDSEPDWRALKVWRVSKGVDKVYRVSACGKDVKGAISLNSNTYFDTAILSTPV